jgi:hypothetical protein
LRVYRLPASVVVMVQACQPAGVSAHRFPHLPRSQEGYGIVVDAEMSDYLLIRTRHQAMIGKLFEILVTLPTELISVRMDIQFTARQSRNISLTN